MKKGVAAGPDPVTNRGVSQDALLRNTLYRWWRSVKGGSPRIGSSLCRRLAAAGRHYAHQPYLM
jgi:hypothetical protein